MNKLSIGFWVHAQNSATNIAYGVNELSDRF